MSAEERKQLNEDRNERRRRQKRERQLSQMALEQEHFSFDKNKMQLYNVEE